MRGRKKSYVISVPGILGALALPIDLFGVATVIADNLSLAAGLVPWVGMIVAAGFGTWLSISLATDGPRYYKMRQRRTRRSITAIMQRVADSMEWYSDTGESSFSVHEDHTLQSERSRADINIDIEKLECMGLMPRPTNRKTRHHDIANQLYRTIPVVERKGVCKARDQIRAMNAFWKERAEKGKSQ